MSSKTLFLLMAEFDGRTAIPLADALHYTNYSSLSEANKAANAGTLPIPAFRMADSQKSPYIVHLEDLAESIDAARNKAVENFRIIQGKAPVKKRETVKTPSNDGPNRRGRRANQQQVAMRA